MNNPSFRIGMKFSGVEELRKAIITYSIRNRKTIKKTKNYRRRLEAHCDPECTWSMKASNKEKRTGGFVSIEDRTIWCCLKKQDEFTTGTMTIWH
jgi:hypothetical protein